MILEWLVFSDLHFQFNNSKTGVMRNKLLDFFEKKNKEYSFALIAGDCFYQNNKSEKDIEDVENFIHRLLASCVSDKSNIHITMGNHDIIRSEDRLRLLSGYTGIDYNLGKMVGKEKEISAEAIELLLSDTFCQPFYELRNKITGKNTRAACSLFEGNNYRILNINTSVLSGGYYNGDDVELSKEDKHYDEKSISVYNTKLIEESERIKDDDRINIAFMHHGIEYHRESERKDFEHLMEDRHIDIVFAGHSHKIGVLTYDKTRSKIQEFTCGAPIADLYSRPSFFECSFDTDSKNLVCNIYAYYDDINKWKISDGDERIFDKGKRSFIPYRFQQREQNKEKSIDVTTLGEEKKEYSNKNFDKFGILNVLPKSEFMALRNKLIQEAKGTVTLAGQSLENAFDLRKDSESIVESIKNNKAIKHLEIILTDPIVFDTSKEIYTVGDTPIIRISNTMRTIFNDIASALNEDQIIDIYFIPLVQLDHMVFVNDILLLRNTLLWTNDSHYKATPIVCKNVTGTGINESIVKSSMYNVYREYVEKLKDESIEIVINEKGEDRHKETMAKIFHREWRGRLYSLRNSKKMRGNIIMHKLYHKQLISDLHSSWDSRFRSFSKEINWADETESTSFISGNKTAIKSHDDLFDPINLLNDTTQQIILPYVKKTEDLLNKLVKKYDKQALARIYPSLDIGIPNNILRLAGGFATGMLIIWKCGTPIVPIDTTVNVCSSSYYQFDASALKGTFIKDFFNLDKINLIINEGSKEEGLAFSFDTGNHFLMLCKNRETGMYYLVLHSSAKQFKDTYFGLYPKPNNWYSEFVKVYKDEASNRYIRYLKDAEAEQFINIARMLNRENEDIHNWFANRFCAKEGIHFTEHKTYHHYGMPTDYSIAIGTYVIDDKDIVPIFSKEGYPIQLFSPNKNMWSIELEGKMKYVVPHGWGQAINWKYFKQDTNDKELGECMLDIEDGNLLLKDGRKEILKKFTPEYDKRFSEQMVGVRELWEENNSAKKGILNYKKYISGQVLETLYPVALFSKTNNGVKYYEENPKEPFIFS